MAELREIVSLLDEELNPHSFPDESNNGLQVENSGNVEKIWGGVCASLEFIRRASAEKGSLAFCHHGLSWGGALKTITGADYRKIGTLLKADAALYACHLPLDAHPKLGNNAVICRKLGLSGLAPYGRSADFKAGFSGSLAGPEPYAAFRERCLSLFGKLSAEINFGESTVRTAAVVSGGGASEIEAAGEGGVDVFISGEPRLSAYNFAKESGLNAIFAGHYATEVFGVKEVLRLLGERFRIETEFVDFKIDF